LLNDTPPYVDAFLELYGSKYHDRKISQNTLVVRAAVELWKASAPVINKVIDNHRSGVIAQKMKTDILTGKHNLYAH
jgi:hypothetical protein